MAFRQLLPTVRCPIGQFRFGSSAVSVPAVNQTRASKTEMLEVNTIQLDKFATYSQVPFDVVDPRISSGLVLLLPWTLAKQAHVSKFEKYYLKKGFNVLTVHTPTRHLLLSELYRKKLETVAQELQSPSSIKPFSKMFVHAFSIGHFTLGQLLMEMDKAKVFRNIPTSVVVDSAFDYRTLIFALVRTFPFPVKVQDSLYPICKLLWMKLLPGLGGNSNLKVYEEMHNRKFDRALVLTSKVDPIGTEDYSKQFMEMIRANGTEVKGKIFESSPHVMHFVKYQKEYLQYLEPFVTKFVNSN